MPHPVIWYEVIGKDGAALSRFYGELFDWKMEEVQGDYYMASAGEGPPTGGVGSDPAGGDGHVTWYAEVDDLQAMLDKAESLGGKTVMPPSEPMSGTTIALLADPEGHVVGIVKPGPPPEG